MLMPKKQKYRKRQKGRIRGRATSGNKVVFGDFGMKSTGYGQLTSRQIEAARIAINRAVKRGGKLVIRIFPDIPRTKKPLEVRQGKGKGNVEYYVAIVKPGTVMFEIEGVDKATAAMAFKRAAAKLPVGVLFVEREIL